MTQVPALGMVDELAALSPEAIFIGHAHFDHAADATPIALASGATLVGTAEQCATAVPGQQAHGIEAVIQHGATPTQLAPVVEELGRRFATITMIGEKSDWATKSRSARS